MHYNIVKKASRAYLEEMHNRRHEQPEVFECINLLQRTPFKINVKVLQVAKSIWEKGLTVGKMPSSVAEEIPPKPFDIATNLEARREWSRIKRAICDANETRTSKVLLFENIFKIADDYVKYDKISFPHQYDWRGRIYTIPQFFNVQNNDLARGLLLFANGKELGSDQALCRLAICGANSYGEADKDTLENRVKWVEDNEQKIIATAKDPHNHYDFWGNCSEPFQFLAFCFEWNDFKEFGSTSDFVTHLPCYSDCTNSGLQIFSALLADDRGGKATNLTPEELPQDVYKEVADETLNLLMAEPDSVLKDMWLEYGIDRYTTKKVTMCIVYGLTQFKSKDYIKDSILDNIEEGIDNPFSTERDKKEGVPTLYEATQFLSKFVWLALDKVVNKSKTAMKWLQQIAKLVAENNIPLTWTTPNGFVVEMKCPEMVAKRINTNMGQKIWRPNTNKGKGSWVDDVRKTTINVESNKISVDDSINAIASCYVHSLDGALLQKSVVKANKAGIKNFACIHDSFGVLAPDVVQMNNSLREAFVDIFHNTNLLEDFAKEIHLQVHKDKRDKIPAVPEKGTLDVSNVLKSLYFCS